MSLLNRRHVLWLAMLGCCLLMNACVAESAQPSTTTQPAPVRRDVVIYGGTPAAITAAIQARKMGRSVVIVCPEKHIGGMTVSGLGWTDSGRKEVIGGLAREFYHRIYQHYQSPDAWGLQPRENLGSAEQRARLIDDKQQTMWIFEPHVAEQVFESWIKEHGIEVIRDAWLDRSKGVTKQGSRIQSIRTLDGRTFAGKVFLDATYEGDLMAAAGVRYAVGRESNQEFGETLNGVQTRSATGHQFPKGVSPYRVPDDPASGLLPLIHDGEPGEEGQGDQRIQAYNFRMCLTNVPQNRVPFMRPAKYDADRYELLLRTLQAGSRHVFGKFDPMPNGKTDTNNHGPFSTDHIGMNYDYPEASYQRRREIIQEHRDYQQGYFYFLVNDERVPAEVRSRMGQWGLAKDEFVDNEHWPWQLYIREARRMRGQMVITEQHLRRTQPTEDPVGMGSYNMDSHHTQRYVARDEQGWAMVRNEGDVQVNPGGPYPISFRALLPRQEECDNLMVPVCVSATHIAYGSVRMEPVFMILGQSAGTAAAMAVEANVPVPEVNYAALAARLKADGQVLSWTPPPPKPKTEASPKAGKE